MKKNLVNNDGKVFFFIVQEEEGGIPFEPEVYYSRATAEKRYVYMVNKNHHKSFRSFGEANDFMNSDDACWDKWGTRLFECPLLSAQTDRNEIGDRCFADTMRVDRKGNTIVLFAEVDGISFDSSEYSSKKQWLQAIVRRVHDCSLGQLN